MKPKKLLLLTFFLVSTCLTGLTAQYAIVPVGGDASSSGGAMSYTVGQIAYLSTTTTGGSVYEGVQQPFYIVGIEEVSILSQFCSLFPNPSIGDVTLQMEGIPPADLNYQLYSQRGQLLATHTILTHETVIPLQHLPAGVYFLKVEDGHGDFSSFKIIKIR